MFFGGALLTVEEVTVSKLTVIEIFSANRLGPCLTPIALLNVFLIPSSDGRRDSDKRERMMI